MAKQISLSITNFAQNGDPNHDTIPEWPLYVTDDVRKRKYASL